ncbi:MAG: 2,3-bisphosphoglycerate-independent phosphoglycerate mutase [Candidatus Woesebacteria bacterium GW2011_GWA1_33_30]|uniref:2,3-bisphosphoglycerate-independent phosphoglycerate mutase n=1 Tax=Candidatus Woesebacteria bacterium GW2011_GWA2_33_28 TaxID=1618561 RepID=A0A0G0C6Z6_9BACT|nr:MAG: 2,3-bisphosphoglycerate-independent phosphoglycerate mutase [Candidatus Woesebacteria bacterium GW2011_GWA2_33_28]KKP47864.1 MAG: 2,3-bisphosphoglycerate-independent phosphoglycerate mutase [Candidatus Woesebacteria bacterium GW2011_GWA1_33_30]KKP49307.1 MAG: 2,3-bisphosphoglycerate-independent phosphoglycerate mutase [Microgenomates group bacterium GW2011_GWC1_33_32]KKP52017.1 MAG: 2,3-bisphosphoglycerate-independent phosphoglycerate mutase [Candidatus Woesebacteria bacterium GW2011_GWB
MTPKFVILTVLDGWGISAPSAGNAISIANCINMNRYTVGYPHTELQASGESVGLPRGEAGNTETGHLNLGAGRIIYQDLMRINMSIAEGTFFDNKALLGALEHANKFKSNLHIMGLIGAGGVHSNLEHLFALLQLCSRNKFNRVYLHLFTDGRDSPPTAAKIYLNKIKEVINREGVGQIATLMGRYWAMDRDFRWDRTEKAYNALTKGEGNLVKTPEEAIEASYDNGKTDEFIDPALIMGRDGKPVKLIADNDSVIFFNFRVDRPRQLSRSFVFNDFSKATNRSSFDPFRVKYLKKHIDSQNSMVQVSPFKRPVRLNNLYFATMTEYEKILVNEGAKVAFPPESVDTPIGRAISDNGLRQLRASESEKEKFVTFYFNGQQEMPFELEEHLIVPSPKVATYDLKPEMSAIELTDSVLERLKTNLDYKFILINYANPDMVGHTGNIGSAVKACQVTDECVARLANFVLAYDGALVITADHGNVEEMINSQSGQIETEHSTNPVPLIIIAKDFTGRGETLPSGILADVAPTVLNLLKIPIPSQMSGRNLLEGFVFSN